MKSKFLAGLIATFVSIIVVVCLALFLALVIDIDPKKNWFTYTAAFITISTWVGIYKWLKPKAAVELDNWGSPVHKKVKQIDHKVFKEAYARNPRILIRVGIFLAITCLPGSICLLIFPHDPSSAGVITGFIILFIIGGFGVFFVLKGFKLSNAIKNGTDHLMNAIETNNTDHVVWFYGKATDIHGSIKESKLYQISIFSKDRSKPASLGLKNEKSYDEILAFLAATFPNAESTTNDTIRHEMKAKYGFRMTR